MLAEDDADLRAVYAECLRRDGHVVWRRPTAARPSRLVRAHLPDLLLLDIWMPILNGLEVLEHLGRTSEAVGLKIVVLSHLSDADTRLEGFALGVDDYWTKDLSLVELCADPALAGPVADPAAAPRAEPVEAAGSRCGRPGRNPAVRRVRAASGPGLPDRSPPDIGPEESNSTDPPCCPTIKNASTTSTAG